MKKPDCLIIECCDYMTYPPGGQLSFARQMMSIFGNRLGLVGVSTDGSPVGRWINTHIDGEAYYLFNIGHRDATIKKPLIPSRLSGLLQLARYQSRIMGLGVSNLFIQAPELLMVASKWDLGSICYRFPGIGNPLEMPRYAWGKPLAGLFDKALFRALRKVECILACADDRAIEGLAARSSGVLTIDRIIKFPTRVDTELFKPMSKAALRSVLNLDRFDKLIAVCGRINRVKGWDFVLDAFKQLSVDETSTGLVFVGDGEDRPRLEQMVADFSLTEQVIITGFQPPDLVVKYLNAADIAVVGSHEEGWSIAMLEAMACGKPVVSTYVSGAKDMIHNGQNGFVVEDRNAKQFASAIIDGLCLPDPNPVSLAVAEKYALKFLKADLQDICPFLR